jgi:hypothetical protein
VVAGNRRWTCLSQLISLVVLLFLFPFLENLAKPLFLVMALAGVFVAGVTAAQPGRAQVRCALVLAAVQTALTGTSIVLPEGHGAYLVIVILAMLTMVALMLFTIYCVLGYVMRARVVTHDQIFAGVSMYLMLGFAFAAIYYLLNMLDPHSFVVASALSKVQESPDLMYFSFVTLATLGYGDITPRTDLARSLAVLEALAGMLYIAVFMARLVSLRSAGDDLE